MSQPFIVGGTVRRDDGTPVAGVRVLVDRRQLPSLERRRGGVAQLLGEAVTDDGGRFSVEFDLDGTGAEAPTGSPADAPELGFRAVDRDGTELVVRQIDIRGAEPVTSGIAFNAVSPLAVVLQLDPQRAVDDIGSEYERLVTLLASMISDLAYGDLREDDLAFLCRNFGWADDSDEARRLAILRAASVLGSASGVDQVAFYGWARLGVPDGWPDLPSLDDDAERAGFVSRIMEGLAGVQDQELRDALRRAAEDRLIPASYADRAEAIVGQLRRRDQQLVPVRLRLVAETDRTPLAGCTVAVHDPEADRRLIGVEVSDRGGYVEAGYAVLADAADHGHRLELAVSGPLLSEPTVIAVTVSSAPGLVTDVAVPLAATAPTLTELRQQHHLGLSERTMTVLGEHGITSFAAIRRLGGLTGSAIGAGMDQTDLERLDALTELDRLCSQPAELLSVALHYRSVIEIADTPLTAFVHRVSDPDGADAGRVEAARAAELHACARAQTDLLDLLVAGVFASAYDAAPAIPSDGVQP